MWMGRVCEGSDIPNLARICFNTKDAISEYEYEGWADGEWVESWLYI